MNTRRKLVIALGAGALATPLACFAQPVQKIPRIGFISLQSRASESARIDAFLQGMRDLGYIEGKNFTAEFRHAEGNAERLAAFATELAGLNVDVIVASGTQPTQIVKQATRTIPIVFPLSSDPVGTGLVASLARPGGNVTGLTTITAELSGKRLELLKETVPKLARVAVLANPASPTHLPSFGNLEIAANTFRIQLQLLEMKSPDEVESAFSMIGKQRVQALFLMPEEMFHTRRRQIAALAIKNRLPAIGYSSEWADDGILLFYGANVPDLFRRTATHVDKILKGVKPADLPVERPTKFDLIINLKTAKQIRLKIPRNVLARADRVIE